MKTNKPNFSSGKTFFNRAKEKGQSWVKLREAAIKDGAWKKGKTAT